MEEEYVSEPLTKDELDNFIIQNINTLQLTLDTGIVMFADVVDTVAFFDRLEVTEPDKDSDLPHAYTLGLERICPALIEYYGPGLECPCFVCSLEEALRQLGFMEMGMEMKERVMPEADPEILKEKFWLPGPALAAQLRTLSEEEGPDDHFSGPSVEDL